MVKWVNNGLTEIHDIPLNTNVLNLSYNNRIRRINRNQVTRLINLTAGKQYEVHQERYLHLTSLQNLYLAENSLSELHNSSFSGLLNLISLSLNNNKIEKIQQNVLSAMSKLEILQISGNLMTYMPPLDGFSQLKQLDVFQ